MLAEPSAEEVARSLRPVSHLPMLMPPATADEDNRVATLGSGPTVRSSSPSACGSWWPSSKRRGIRFVAGRPRRSSLSAGACWIDRAAREAHRIGPADDAHPLDARSAGGAGCPGAQPEPGGLPLRAHDPRAGLRPRGVRPIRAVPPPGQEPARRCETAQGPGSLLPLSWPAEDPDEHTRGTKSNDRADPCPWGWPNPWAEFRASRGALLPERLARRTAHFAGPRWLSDTGWDQVVAAGPGHVDTHPQG